MCGIAGILRPGGFPVGSVTNTINWMTASLAHRGPDAAGTWVDHDAGLALGHRRLAIVDLSPAGAQPMLSSDGRWVVSYNGEVYNARDIAAQLQDGGVACLRGQSDTEVLAEAIARWGVRGAIDRCIGMFAFAAWDRKLRSLHLARDRMGIKPLYWGRCGRSWVFGSELSALRRHPDFDGTLDQDAVAAYYRYGTVPAPWTVFRSVHKLEPGSLATFRAGYADPKIERYWSASEIAASGKHREFEGNYADALTQLDSLLSDSVRCRMVADVPLGAFLSGGIDSSVVVAYMQKHSPRPVKTFTIGFEDPAYDESAAAERVASALGTDHTTLVVRPGDAQEVIPHLPKIFDEPFADSSMLPTYLVSKLARQDVTVALSGDGGDELFGGYNRHIWGPRVWNAIRVMPLHLRRAAANLIRARTPSEWDRTYATAERAIPRSLRLRTPGDKLHKLARVLVTMSPEEMHSELASSGGEFTRGPMKGADPWRSVDSPSELSIAERMMLVDLVTYLPDDILTKVDRASMAVSLEARVPLLDHRVVALAWSFPQRWRIRRGVSKAPLRDLLERRVPRALFERPKSGFGIPIGEWLRGPLRPWAENLLCAERIQRNEALHVDAVQRLWANHLARRVNAEQPLWSLLMFEAWLDASDSTEWH